MLQFISNKQRNVIDDNVEISYHIRTFHIILDINCMHVSSPDDMYIFDGNLYEQKDGCLSFISYDMSSIMTLSIVANKIVCIGSHILCGSDISSSMLFEQTVDFALVHSMLGECQDRDKKKYIATLRDRGIKKTILTLPWYSPNKIYTIFNDNYWGQMSNYYITWLKYYCLGNDNDISDLYAVLSDFSDKNLLDRILLNDRSHCLGAALCLSELLDRLVVYSSKLNINNAIYPVLYLSLLTVLVYLATYKGQDALMDSQLYAILGRICDVCKKEIVSILFSNGISNFALIDDLYVFSMYNASQSAQDAMSKTEYYKNSLMMHQNQTVSHVTTDHMDESYFESINLGVSTFNTLVFSMTECFKSGQNTLSSEQRECIKAAIDKIISSYIPQLSKIKSICIIHSFDKQQGNFPTVDFIKNRLDSFYEQINLITTPIETQREDGSFFVQIKNRQECNIESDILWLNIGFDTDRIITSICIRCFHRGYDLKKEIEKTNIFHGFVCQVSFSDLTYSPQEILLLPFLANEYI